MSKYNFNIGMYDDLFFNKIIERGTEIYLSDKIFDFTKKDNYYSCKVKGSHLYDVTISFNDEETYKIDTVNCTCPYANDGYHCKHMYALLLKVKCNYDLDNIEKDIKNELKNIKYIFKENDKQYAKYKFNNNYNINAVSFNNCVKSFKIRCDIIERRFKEDNNIINLIIVLKDIIKLRSDIYYRLSEFADNNVNDVNNYESDDNNYIEKEEYNNSPGLFSLFINTLDRVNEAQEKKDRELEKEKQRYRNAIVEKNLYEGKIYDDLYDELNGEYNDNN